ncbi:MAG: orotidine-5'-phosphate decarboxylase [Candidatus Aminicenantes bacterium]|nr:orotidine-5'-phosphate decarboxylase [Candidatus Aminicenantes bacterium]
MRLKERIIIALDVGTRDEALRLVEQLDEARVFKVGLELFTAEGPTLLEDLTKRNKTPFLDLKCHDIPNTVAGAVRSAVRHGAAMLTLHASGGVEMMRRAAEAAGEVAARQDRPKPLLFGVTVLTSLKDSDLEEVGFSSPTGSQVLRLAHLARRAGLDGVVSSPQEIELIRKEMGSDLLVVTPGVRPAWAAAHDQKRVMTPAEAIRLGADYLVIGRPVTAAPSPGEALQKILDEVARAQA